MIELLLKKIVVKLGGVDVSKENYVDTFTENIIETVNGKKIAALQDGGIWIEFSELNDYRFMEVHIVGFQNYKTFKGAELFFIMNRKTILHLNSDCQEIVSSFSNVSNRYFTSVSFDITNVNLDILSNSEAESIIFKCMKKEEEFKII